MVRLPSFCIRANAYPYPKPFPVIPAQAGIHHVSMHPASHVACPPQRGIGTSLRWATEKGSRRGAEAAEASQYATASLQRRLEPIAPCRLTLRLADRRDRPSLRWGDGNIRLRAPIPQNCHSRESGNPWPDISAYDAFLVRTKTRRQGATSLCLRAFVRTILPIAQSMGSRFLRNDILWGSRRGAAMSAAVGGVRSAQTKRAGGFPPAPFLCILRSALRAGDVCQIDLEAWAHGRADRHAADIFAL